MLLDHIKEPKSNLKYIQESFNHINNVYRTWVEAEIQTQTAFPANAPNVNKTPSPSPVLIDQNDMYVSVFQKLDGANELEKLEWVLIAYLRSLFDYGIPAAHNLNELLVTTLVRALISFLRFVLQNVFLRCRSERRNLRHCNNYYSTVLYRIQNL